MAGWLVYSAPHSGAPPTFVQSDTAVVKNNQKTTYKNNLKEWVTVNETKIALRNQLLDIFNEGSSKALGMFFLVLNVVSCQPSSDQIVNEGIHDS